jgi:hypothetical protein
MSGVLHWRSSAGRPPVDPNLDGVWGLASVWVMGVRLRALGTGGSTPTSGALDGLLDEGFLGVERSFVLSGFLLAQRWIRAVLAGARHRHRCGHGGRRGVSAQGRGETAGRDTRPLAIVIALVVIALVAAIPGLGGLVIFALLLPRRWRLRAVVVGR